MNAFVRRFVAWSQHSISHRVAGIVAYGVARGDVARGRRRPKSKLAFDALESRLAMAADLGMGAGMGTGAIGEDGWDFEGCGTCPAETDNPSSQVDLGGAIARFFISDQAPDELDAIANPTIHLREGEVKKLYIYAQVAPHERLFSVALNLETSTDDVLYAARHDIHNPADDSDCYRWFQGETGPFGGTLNPPGALFVNSIAAAVIDRGLRMSREGLIDSTYNAELQTVLHSTVTIYAGTAGTTELFLSTGRALTAANSVVGHEDEFIALRYGSGDELVDGHIPGTKSTIADATIVVSSADSPIPQIDRYSLIAADHLEVAAPRGVLANDPVAGATARLYQSPSFGNVELRPDGSFTYTPRSGYSGSDSFLYAVVVNGETVGIGAAMIDIPPVVRFQAAEFQLNEDILDPNALSNWITIDFSMPLLISGELHYQLHDGTATAADGDFTATEGVLALHPGQTSARFRVPIAADTKIEPNETFSIELTSARGVSIDPNGRTIQVQIIADEPLVGFTTSWWDDFSDVERVKISRPEYSNFVGTIQLSQASMEPVDVHFRIVDGTATAADGDFIRTSGTVRFRPGDVYAGLRDIIADDPRAERDETFTIELWTDAGAVVPAKFQRIHVTILDDDQNVPVAPPVIEPPADLPDVNPPDVNPPDINPPNDGPHLIPEIIVCPNSNDAGLLARLETQAGWWADNVFAEMRAPTVVELIRANTDSALEESADEVLADTVDGYRVHINAWCGDVGLPIVIPNPPLRTNPIRTPVRPQPPITIPETGPIDTSQPPPPGTTDVSPPVVQPIVTTPSRITTSRTPIATTIAPPTTGPVPPTGNPPAATTTTTARISAQRRTAHDHAVDAALTADEDHNSTADRVLASLQLRSTRGIRSATSHDRRTDL